MHQTYHGDDGRLNVGAKGLTGEKYSGWTFWDSETYCLPFYMFNNPKAAKNLLMYRYNTLPQAKERSIEQDCKGACYPMVTIDGTESCGVWQHGNLEIHVTAAIAYGVWHYVRNTGDEEFLKDYGLELLVETSRYFASRGDWSPKTGEFGLWGVMGPDEFHMMVHNNTYTNFMVKKNFLYTIEMVKKYGYDVPAEELAQWQNMADKMRINYDEKTKLFEQHDGYFDFPKEMLTEGAIAASYLNTVSSCTVEYTHYSGAIAYSYTLPCNGDYFTKELVTDALSMLTSVINEFHPYLKKLASREYTLDEFLDNIGI
jgi:maltose phosphorylase